MLQAECLQHCSPQEQQASALGLLQLEAWWARWRQRLRHAIMTVTEVELDGAAVCAELLRRSKENMLEMSSFLVSLLSN